MYDLKDARDGEEQNFNTFLGDLRTAPRKYCLWYFFAQQQKLTNGPGPSTLPCRSTFYYRFTLQND